jgi:hypothetical protein
MSKKRCIDFLCHARRRAFQLRFRYCKHHTVRLLAGRCGFFGNMFMTLNGIRTCEAAGVLPQPFWDQESLFFEESRGSNVWEYYFEQVVMPGLNGFAEIPARIAFKPDAAQIGPQYNGESIRETYHLCMQKYVRLRASIRQEIELAKAELFGDFHVIGVHARFTDTALGFEKRSAPSLTEYFKKIDEYSAANRVDRIFIATDYLPALEQFQQRYGDKIVALECIRSDGATSIHGHYDSGLPGSPYRKGLEVVRDAYLLASVSHLLRTNSRVTSYSLCLNPKLTFTNVAGDTSGCCKSWLDV